MGATRGLAVAVVLASAFVVGRSALRSRAEIARLTAELERVGSRLNDVNAESRRQTSAIEALKKNPFVVYSIVASIAIECDEATPTSAFGTQRADPNLAKAGTMIRLRVGSTDLATLHNTDLSMRHADLGSSRHRFEFSYEPEDMAELRGRYTDALAQVDSLVVSFRPVMHALGYCDQVGEVATFEFSVNGLTVIRLSGLGAFGNAASAFDVSAAFSGVTTAYANALEVSARR